MHAHENPHLCVCVCVNVCVCECVQEEELIGVTMSSRAAPDALTDMAQVSMCV